MRNRTSRLTTAIAVILATTALSPLTSSGTAEAAEIASSNRMWWPERLDLGALRQHRPGVQAGVHLHDGDAGLGVAVENRPLDRGGAAVIGQQRRVNIQTTEAR